MRAGVRTFVAVMAGTVLAVVLVAYRGTSEPASTRSTEEEVMRVRAHLAAVEAELLKADVSQLTPAQRAARMRHIAVLREYRQAGVFPHNHTVPDHRVPVFVDEHGTHCAVGHLLARDGRHDVVERVRRTRNHATVPELADVPDLVAWLAEAGLTLEEAARIQPAYDPIDPPAQRSSTTYKDATVLAAGLGIGMSAWNLAVAGDAAARDLAGALGAGVGLAELVLGAVGLIDRASNVQPGYIAVNFGVGAIAGALGMRNVLRGEPSAPRATDGGTSAPQRVQLHLSPWAPALDGGVGVRLDVRF